MPGGQCASYADALPDPDAAARDYEKTLKSYFPKACQVSTWFCLGSEKRGTLHRYSQDPLL